MVFVYNRERCNCSQQRIRGEGMYTIVSDNKAKKKNDVSAKARSLILLDKLGLTPSFIIIQKNILQTVVSSTRGYLPNIAQGKDFLSKLEIPPGIRSEIKFALKRAMIKGKVAVRSASWMEDGERKSSAGMLDSFLNVSLKDVFAVIPRCWASAANERMISYLKKKGEEICLLSTDVIVQKMVPQTVKGHIYSHLEEQNLLCIEYEQNGAKDSDFFFLGSWMYGRLPRHILKQILKSCEQLREVFPASMDIEFVVNRGKVWFVQARPLFKAMEYFVVPFSTIPPTRWDEKKTLTWMRRFATRIFLKKLDFHFYSGVIFYNTLHLRNLLIERRYNEQRYLIARIVKYFEMVIKRRRPDQFLFLSYAIINQFFMHKTIYLFGILEEKYPQIAEQLNTCSCSFSVAYFLKEFKSSDPVKYQKLFVKSQHHRKKMSRLIKSIPPKDRVLVHMILDLFWCKDYMNFFQQYPLFQPPYGWRRTVTFFRAEDIQRLDFIAEGNFSGEVVILTDKRADMEGKDVSGKVIVTKETWPWQLPFLLECCGVVVETPGQTSHAAMIARELDIPFVAGARGILREVRSGDYIKVVNGTIKINKANYQDV